jgi:hypothetical protein
MAALQQVVKEIVASNDSLWAWENYKRVVLFAAEGIRMRSAVGSRGGENSPN